MIVAIVGSRSFRTEENYKCLTETLEPYKNKITAVISGGAKGADSLAYRWAKENNIDDINIFHAKWNDTEGKPSYEIGYNQYGSYWKFAGHARNDLMAEECDCCIAFWDGESSGTRDMIQACKQKNKPVKIVKI